MNEPLSFTPRSVCYRCRRAQAICQCSQLRPFRTEQDWVILMHPREAWKAIGTGRMTHQSLEGSQLWEGVCFDQDPRVQELLADSTRQVFLVFPGTQAVTTAQLEKASGKRLTLILIDGTWAQARTMLARSPQTLARLPRLAFQPSRPSGYRIRQQPGSQCFSTLEAAHTLIDLCAQAGLGAIPLGRPHDQLLVLFEQLVTRQERFESEPRPPNQ